MLNHTIFSSDGNDPDNVRLFDTDVIYHHEAVLLSQGDMLLIVILKGGNYGNEVILQAFINCFLQNVDIDTDSDWSPWVWDHNSAQSIKVWPGR